MDWHQREDLRLQKKAKQWLEVVTGQEFRADDSLTDLLADGVVLKSAGRKIKRMLNKGTPAKDNEKASDEKFERRLSVGAYTPYNNIDEFISVCKAVGVLDIDLFVASDVVERSGDLRMLVLCIRALSRKCRALDLPVPDFDNVSAFHRQSTPDGSTKGVPDIERFPSLVMPPVVDRESSVTPDKGGDPSEFDFGGVRRLDLGALESPSTQTPAEKSFVTEEVATRGPETGSGTENFQVEAQKITKTSVLVPESRLETATDQLPIKDEAPPPIDASLLPSLSNDILAEQAFLAKVVDDKLAKHGEGGEVGGVVAAPGLSSKGEADYPSRDVSHSRKSVDDLQGGSYMVVTNKTAAGEVSRKAGVNAQGRKSVDDLQGGSYIVVTNDKKRDASTKGLDTTPQSSLPDKTAGASSIATAPPVLQSNTSGNKAIEASNRATTLVEVEKASVDLPAKAVHPPIQTSGKDLGDSTSKVTEPLQSIIPDRKASRTAVSATPSTPLDRKPVGVSPKLGSPLTVVSTTPSSPLDRKASRTAVSATPSTPLDRKPVGISPKLGSPPTVGSTTPSTPLDRKPVGLLPKVGSPPTAVSTTPSTPLDRKPVGSSAKLGSPQTATKNGDVSAKGPSVIQSPTRDTKPAELPRRTVWPLVQPNASDRKPEDVTSRSRSPIVADKNVGERPTSRAAQSNEPDSKIGSLATKPTSPVAHSVNKEEDDPPGVSSKRLWIPIVAGACALVGTFVAYRFRGATSEYQVREGDTLYGISKKTGKENWEDLARINPQINNPNLIYPSNRLKLN